jgi:hypothetical protein
MVLDVRVRDDCSAERQADVQSALAVAPDDSYPDEYSVPELDDRLVDSSPADYSVALA